MLGVTERTFRRWRARWQEGGPEGLVDRRIGRESGRRAAAAEIELMLGLYVGRYSDFTVKHFHEQLVKRHGYKLGYTVTRLCLQSAGLVRAAPRRPAHRKKRARRPLPGMMLHQDASRFAWLGGDAQYDLVVTLDNATSAIYSAFLVAEEGTASTLRGLGEVIARHACSANSTPIAAVTTSIRRRLARRCHASSRRRWVVRWRSWGSAISRPIRPRHGAGRSGRSAPCRTGCQWRRQIPQNRRAEIPHFVADQSRP